MGEGESWADGGREFQAERDKYRGETFRQDFLGQGRRKEEALRREQERGGLEDQWGNAL